MAPTLRLAALAAGIAAAAANCAFNGGINYNTVPGKFSPSGTILGLRVGGTSAGGAGSAALVSGVAQPLFVDEINVATGAIVQTFALPATGSTLGKNLACTLTTGMFASSNWNYPSDDNNQPLYCNAAYGQPGLVNPKSGDCQRLYGNPANSSASPHWKADWNVDPVGGGHGGGEYGLWFFDREGLMRESYDGRFVTFPCYMVSAGNKFKLGQWYESNPAIYASDALSYDDKVLATLRWDGVVDTVTHLPGTQFFYGPILPDEPTYVTSAITTGDLWPTMAFFTGNAGDNGEGTMDVPFDSLAATKSGNRITNTPGYYDYGMLGMYTNGKLPTQAAAGDPPLLFVTSPSMLNQAAENGQHQQYRGLSVGTVGGVPILPPASVTFQPLAGFGNYSGHPFGFVFESTSSVWLADAGPGAQGGPGWPGVTATCSIGTCPPPIALGLYPVGSTPAGLWDKYSCTIQHWTSTADIISGVWSWKESVIVDSMMPCYSLSGRVENGVFVLYTSTSGNDYSSKAPNSVPYPSTVPFPATGVDGNGGYKTGTSKLYKVNTATKAVTAVVTAPANTVYRSVAIPPQQRGNYTCPAGQYGVTYDLTCSYNCCTKCTATCAPGLVLVPLCSYASDNLCLDPSTFQALANILSGSTANTVAGALTVSGIDTTTLANPAAVQVISNSIVAALQGSIAKASGAAAPVLSVKITSIKDAVTGQSYYAGSRRLAAATAMVAYSITCGSASAVALAQTAANNPALGPAVVTALPAQAALAGVSASAFASASAQTVQTSYSSGSSSSDSSSSGNAGLAALVLLLIPIGAAGYYFYSKKDEDSKPMSSASVPSTPAEERNNPIRSNFAPTAATRAVALASLAALAMGSVCLPGGNNPNNVGAGKFAPAGTVLALRVGDGASALIPGVATALFVDEINVATGAVVTTIALPNTGSTLGKNLACTLATGMFAAPFWDFGATPFNPTFAGVAATSTSPALPAYSASYGAGVLGYTQRTGLTFDKTNPTTGWGVQGPFPAGSYPLWYFDREGLLANSYDGRFVTFPCYVTTGQKGTTAGSYLKLGSAYNNPCCSASPVPSTCTNCPTESLSYDDKSIAMIRWDGVVDTITHLPGNQFFYGPIIPDEPQYMTAAITTGELWPYVSYFSGNSGDNGEGTMNIPFDSLAPSKSGNRITNTPGYYDYGMLGMFASSGPAPTSTTTAAPPLLFVSSPSQLNQGAVNSQHQFLKGISVGTVGGVPILPPGGVTFQQLAGFGNFTGHPFQFWFESQSSVWIADAGLGAFDKTSCAIQHWTSTADITSGTWSKASTISVDSAVPCYSLAGRMENGVPTLYTSTSTAASSKVYKIAGGVVSTVVTAAANTVYRGVAIPPQPRGNYTCPVGQYGTTYDLSCSYGCCEPCTTSCPAGQKLVPVCSFESDNLCVDAGSYSALAAAVKAKTNGGRLLLAADGELAAEGSAEINAEHSTEDLTLIARIARALGLSA